MSDQQQDAGAEAPAGVDSGGAQERPLPHLYRSLTPIARSRHENLCLRATWSYGFARASHAMVVNVEEFRAAARRYPIVFMAAETPLPMVLLGVGDSRNLFVDEAGQWEPDAHVPLYIQRYPFMLVPHPDGQQTILLIDEQSDLIEPGGVEAGGRPLFREGAPSDLAKKGMELCRVYVQQDARTRAFVAELTERELLVDRVLTFRLPGGGNRRLTGLKVVDPERFSALPDEVVLDWRRRGLLPALYWHLLSLDNLAGLQRRALARAG